MTTVPSTHNESEARRASSPRRPAVFLDRDGTIIEDRGYLADSTQVVYIDGALEALVALSPRFALFIVTNQSGIAKGYVTAAEVDAVNRAVVERIGREGVIIEDVYVCPHTRDDGCDCIKPRPTFLERASQRYGLDLRRSYTVGDHPHDAELATPVGATGIYLLTGHGERHRAELPDGYLVLPDLASAAQWILEREKLRPVF